MLTRPIFPPRPENAINPLMIPFYEKRGWWADIKKNGTCTVIDVQDDGAVEWWTRHGERHRQWTPTAELTAFFQNFPGSTIVGELLHNKGPSVKNTIYVFDIIRHDGNSLIGTTFRHRREKVLPEIAKVVPLHGNVWIAKTHTRDLLGLFKGLHDPLDEGVVLKNPDGILEPCWSKTNNNGWQVKSRRPHKNYTS